MHHEEDAESENDLTEEEKKLFLMQNVSFVNQSHFKLHSANISVFITAFFLLKENYFKEKIS